MMPEMDPIFRENTQTMDISGKEHNYSKIHESFSIFKFKYCFNILPEICTPSILVKVLTKLISYKWYYILNKKLIKKKP